MAWPKGRTKSKTGGRKPGAPNRPSLELQEALTELGLDLPQRIVALLPKLAPKAQVDVLLKLMDFIYPKRKAVEIETRQESTFVAYFDGMSDEAKRKNLRGIVERLGARVARLDGEAPMKTEQP